MGKTVKVKIGVVVDETGDWSAIGYRNMKPDEIGVAADGVQGTALRWFWLEAELPTPLIEAVVVETANITETADPA